jgi:hypothetical protein
MQEDFMKRSLFLMFFIALIMNSLSSQEMQISFGAEAAFGNYKVDNDSAFRTGTYGTSAYFLNENTSSSFFAPGISINLRVFNDEMPYSRGFFFRDRAIFATNISQYGTASINDVTVRISENYSIKNDNFFLSMMDFDIGMSDRFIISKKLRFYTDLGINLTVMDYESDSDSNTGDTLSYLGTGIFANLALQVSLTNTLYLEFGLNSIINAFSSQKGTYFVDEINGTPVYKTINYKSSGRWDYVTSAAYINIGWRIDLNKLRVPVTPHPANTDE